MKTETLIHELRKDAQPVKRVRHPVWMFFQWIFIAFFCMAAGVAVIGLRSDLDAASLNPSLLLQAGFTLALGLLSALSAFLLAVPDRPRVFITSIPLLTFLLWLSVILREFFLAGAGEQGVGLPCLGDILVMGVPPGVLLFLMLRKAAPLKTGKVGLFAALAAGAFGAFGTQMVCHDNDPIHLLIWHYLPVLILGFLGILTGRWLFKWDQSISESEIDLSKRD